MIVFPSRKSSSQSNSSLFFGAFFIHESSTGCNVGEIINRLVNFLPGRA